MTHGSSPAQSHKTSIPSSVQSTTASSNGQARTGNRKLYYASHSSHNSHDGVRYNDSDTGHHRHHHHHRHFGIDTSLFDRGSSKSPHRERHIRSKSYDPRLTRKMNHIASSTGARSLLPTWPGGKERDRDGDDGLLRPTTSEPIQSHLMSESPSGGGTGSSRKEILILSDSDLSLRVGSIQKQEIRSMEDIEQAKRRRKQGEQYLRSSLASIGTLATDMTRRFDYTYYNLLDRIAKLNSIIVSFQDLADSASALLKDVDRETEGLEHEIRRQLEELKGFNAQAEKVLALEERMKVGKKKIEVLGNRLRAAGNEIEDWEKREDRLRTQTNRRLRIFWVAVVTSVLVLFIAIAIQCLRRAESPPIEVASQLPMASSKYSTGRSLGTLVGSQMTADTQDQNGPSAYPSSPA